ncbi:MAG: peptidoglycan DD-metalloendopeptidase family protein [Proteobacteria bacterium]|nr:peptidoglycan DD-metalloendopeptidase family protein [Pseudomonadota bacterium]
MKAAALAALVFLWAPPAGAQDRGDQLRQIESQLEQERARADAIARQAQNEQAELERLQATARQAAAAAMDRETEASDLEAHIAELDEEKALRETRIAGRRVEIASLAGALQRLARQPPEALALEPGTPLDAARTGNLVAGMVAHLNREAQLLKQELDALAMARAGAVRARGALADTLSQLAVERERLDAALARRAPAVARLQDEGRATAARLARLGREAADLRELLGRLDRPAAAAAAPVRAPAGRANPARPGDLDALLGYRWPARGRILESWGQTQAGGQVARGLLIEPREAASVIAPLDGTVAFAGPFRGYGQILILEHGGGYHSILAQLSRIDAVVGQNVTAGEPVGRAGNDERGSPTLYLELRRHGQPVDPSPWLQAAENGAHR